MDLTNMYSEIIVTITPFIVLSGFLALTMSLLSMLINMIIGAATGKGFSIGLK